MTASQPTNLVRPLFDSYSQQDVYCSHNNSAFCSDGADAGSPTRSHKSSIPGYEDLLWQNPTDEGSRNSQDDHEETRCWVWTRNHGWKVWNADGEELWLCKLCHGCSSQEQHWFKSSKSTTRAKLHMKEKHGITARGSRLPPVQSGKKRKLDDYMNVYDTDTCTSSALPVPSSLFGFWKMYLQCIIADELPLPGFGSAHLQHLITRASPQNRLPPLETVSSWIKKAYDRQLSVARDILTSATTKVSMSFRVHAPGIDVRLLGIVAHFIDCEGRPTSTFVSMPRPENRQTTFGVTNLVSAIIDEYDLGKSLGYITTPDSRDSAASMAVAAFTCHLAGKDRRIQCSAHLLNSVAQSILYGGAANVLEGELIAAMDDEIKKMGVWRQRGPCGKLHNIFNYIKRYSQREERFTDIQRRSCAGKPLLGHSKISKLLQDKGTNWESMKDSVEKALHLRSALHDFVDQEIENQDTSQPSIAHDRLTSREWEVLEVYHKILQRIGNTLKVLDGEIESRFGAIWQVLPQFEALLDCLDKSRQRKLAQDDQGTISARLQDVQNDNSIVVAGQNCVAGTSHNGTARQLHDATTQAVDPTVVQDQFNTQIDRVFVQYEFNAHLDAALQTTQNFCETLRGNMLYVAAVVLHPRIKWRFFETKWKDCKDRLSTMKEALSEYWRNDYRDTLARSHSGSKAASCDDTRDSDEWSDGEAWDVDQFEEYQRELPDKLYESTESPVEYWVRRRRRWPQLAAMALDIYSVPIMVGESEIESITKDYSLNGERLDDETQNCLMCLRIWQRDGIIVMDNSLFE